MLTPTESMEKAKKDNKKTYSVAEEQASARTELTEMADKPESKPAADEAKPAATPAAVQPAKPSDDVPANNPPKKSTSEQETELIAINGLMLCALAGGMFYVGTVLFAKDSLLFFTGIFVYLMIAPPGTYVKGKSKMATFTKEVAIAFGLCFAIFMVLKAIMPADADQAKFFTVILTIMGVKLVFFPYYNFKQDDE